MLINVPSCRHVVLAHNPNMTQTEIVLYKPQYHMHLAQQWQQLEWNTWQQRCGSSAYAQDAMHSSFTAGEKQVYSL